MKIKKKAIFILIAINLLIIILGSAYSAYNSSSNIKTNNLQIAKIYVDNQELTNYELAVNDIVPGKDVNYEFFVSNSKNNKKSDVNIEYKLYIETYLFLPLNITIINKDTNENILNCNSGNRNSENKIVCESQSIILNYNEEKRDNYILKLEFPEKKDDGSSWEEDYSEIIDFIDIKIESKQKV